jgi:hypothetical protein
MARQGDIRGVGGGLNILTGVPNYESRLWGALIELGGTIHSFGDSQTLGGTGGSITRENATTGLPPCCRLSSGGAAGNDGILYGVRRWHARKDLVYRNLLFKGTNVGLDGDLVNQKIRFGLTDQGPVVGSAWMNGAVPPGSNLVFQYGAGPALGWECVVSDGVGSLVADSGVGVVLGTVYEFRIEHNGAVAKFYVNGVEVALFDTTTPVANTLLEWALGIETSAATFKTIKQSYIMIWEDSTY